MIAHQTTTANLRAHISFFNGVCRLCEKPYPKGDTIIRIRAGKFAHPGCYLDALEEIQQVPR